MRCCGWRLRVRPSSPAIPCRWTAVWSRPECTRGVQPAEREPLGAESGRLQMLSSHYALRAVPGLKPRACGDHSNDGPLQKRGKIFSSLPLVGQCSRSSAKTRLSRMVPLVNCVDANRLTLHQCHVVAATIADDVG